MNTSIEKVFKLLSQIKLNAKKIACMSTPHLECAFQNASKLNGRVNSHDLIVRSSQALLVKLFAEKVKTLRSKNVHSIAKLLNVL